MKHLRLKVIEGSDQDSFVHDVNNFLARSDVFSAKFQRNMYYAGIGSSEGYTGKKGDVEKVAQGKVKLESSFLGFILYVPGGIPE